MSAHEKHLGEDRPAADEALHRLRFASTFRARLLERLAGDALALQLVALMQEGIAAPRDLATATARAPGEVRAARDRIRYRAEEITKELSASAGSSAPGSRRKEVTQ